jgi:tetratricopeptide (TPR) repeat protein
LGKGDTLEYQAHWHTTKPLIPGQFWFQYSFQHEGIVQDERMEIKVPAERSVKVRGPQATQTVATEAGFRVYTWTYSKLQSATEPGSDQKKQTESERGLLPPPDVEISSFTSWEDVGRWYWNLQEDRIEPAPAIRAKANLHASLGSAYLLAGDREKAGAAFSELADADPKGNYFNDVAHQMANADLQLPLALGYAKKAVRAAEDESHQITLPDLKVEDLKEIFKVAAYWDTLG